MYALPRLLSSILHSLCLPTPTRPCTLSPHPQGINYATWKGQDKESFWPYGGTDGVCVASQIQTATSGNLVKLTSGSKTILPK